MRCASGAGKVSYKRPGGVGRKIVHHHADQIRVRIVDIGQIAHAGGEVVRGPLICHLHMAPRSVRVEKHEQIGRAITTIFTIVTLRLTWRGRDRLAHLADQLCRTFVEANHRALRIGLFGIEIKHVLHPRDIGAVNLRNAPHVPPPRLQVVLGQTPAHRLTRQPFMLRQSGPSRRPADRASSACVPPAGWSRRSQPATPSPCRTACGLPLGAPPR